MALASGLGSSYSTTRATTDNPRIALYSYDAVAPQADLQPVPVHRVAAEDAGQCPERHAEGAEEQGTLDVVGPASHVGQDEGGADSEGRAGGLALDAAQAESELGGDAVVLERIAVGKGFGEQFGQVAAGLVEPAAERLGGSDELGVKVFADGQADGRTTAGLGTRDFGHGPPPSWTGLRKGGSW